MMGNYRLVTALGGQIAGILGIGGRIYGWGRSMVQIPIHVDEGEEARIGEGLTGAVPADPFDARLHADKTAVGMDDAAGEVQLVAHADRVKEIDPVDGGDDRTVRGHQLRADGGEFVGTPDQVTT